MIEVCQILIQLILFFTLLGQGHVSELEFISETEEKGWRERNGNIRMSQYPSS